MGIISMGTPLRSETGVRCVISRTYSSKPAPSMSRIIALRACLGLRPAYSPAASVIRPSIPTEATSSNFISRKSATSLWSP